MPDRLAVRKLYTELDQQLENLTFFNFCLPPFTGGNGCYQKRLFSCLFLPLIFFSFFKFRLLCLHTFFVSLYLFCLILPTECADTFSQTLSTGCFKDFHTIKLASLLRINPNVEQISLHCLATGIEKTVTLVSNEVCICIEM
jgi:hypothetical protein